MMDEIIKGPLDCTYDCARRVAYNLKIVLNHVNKTGFKHPEYKDVVEECKYFDNLSTLKLHLFFRNCKDNWWHAASHAIDFMERSHYNTSTVTSADFEGKLKRMCEHLCAHGLKIDEELLTGSSKKDFIGHASKLCIKAIFDYEETKVGSIIQTLSVMEWLIDRRNKILI